MPRSTPFIHLGKTDSIKHLPSSQRTATVVAEDQNGTFCYFMFHDMIAVAQFEAALEKAKKDLLT